MKNIYVSLENVETRPQLLNGCENTVRVKTALFIINCNTPEVFKLKRNLIYIVFICSKNSIQLRCGRLRRGQTAHWSNRVPPPHLFRQEIHQLLFSDLCTSCFILLLPLLPRLPQCSDLHLLFAYTFVTHLCKWGRGWTWRGNSYISLRYTDRARNPQYVTSRSGKVFSRICIFNFLLYLPLPLCAMRTHCILQYASSRHQSWTWSSSSKLKTILSPLGGTMSKLS